MSRLARISTAPGCDEIDNSLSLDGISIMNNLITTTPTRPMTDAISEVEIQTLAITFVPFLVYFMLTWKDHAHSATVRLFPKEHRLVAHRTVGRISAMIRSFIAGNVLIGLISALVSAIVFWRLGLPYFYFLGVISGFASLVPYIGVFLALLPPLAGGIGMVSGRGVLVILRLWWVCTSSP